MHMLTKHKNGKLNYTNVCNILKKYGIICGCKWEVQVLQRDTESGTDQMPNMKREEMWVRAVIHETNKT